MIYYGCPKCEAAMSSPDSLAGQKEVCPNCGNVMFVPAAQAKAPAPAVPKPPSPPASRARLLWKGRPSHWYYVARYVLVGLMLLAAMIIAAAQVAPEYVPPIIIGVALILLLAAIIERISTHCTVTTQRVVLRTGLLSRSVKDIPIRSIREIQLKQGIIERLVNIGSVGFATAATAGVEVVFRGIPAPLKVKELVRKYSASGAE